MTAALLATVLVVASTLAPSAAPVAEAPASADALVRQAAREYDEGRLDDAIATLERAHALAPLPSILYNIAQVHRARKDCAGALAAYRAYVAEIPPGDPSREKAQRHQAEMQVCVDRQAAGASTSAAAAGPAAPGVPPASPPAIPTGGRPAVRLAAQGPPAVSSQPPSLSTPLTPAQPASAPGRPRPARIAGWALVGAGAVAASAAALLTWRAASISRELSGVDKWDPSVAERDSEGRQYERWARITAATAAVLGGGGATLLIVTRSRAEPAQPVAWTVGWSSQF